MILQRIRVPKKLEGREVDNRDVKSGIRRGVFDDGVDNFDSKRGIFFFSFGHFADRASQYINNNIYLLQLGCHPVAVVILHVYKT